LPKNCHKNLKVLQNITQLSPVRLYAAADDKIASYLYYHISYHIVDLKQQNSLKVGTDKPKLKVKMQSVSDDDDV